MTLDKVVRPFQAPDYAPTPPAITVRTDTGDNVRLEIGRKGSTKTFQITDSTQSSYYMDKAEAEPGLGGEGDEEGPSEHEVREKTLDHSEGQSLRLMMIVRHRSGENQVHYMDEVLTLGVLRWTGSGPDFQRFNLTLNEAKFGPYDEKGEPFWAENQDDVLSNLQSFQDAHQERVGNIMQIFRIRNQKDDSQFVDELKTLGYRVERSQASPIEVMLKNERFQIPRKPEDMSDQFLAFTQADVSAQVDDWIATHPN